MAIAILSVSPAVAQTQQQLNWCLHKNEAFSPRLRIEGCTAAIESNRHAGRTLFSLFYNRGIAYFRKDEYHRAIADFDRALQLDPSSIFALVNRGAAYARKGEFDRAINDFDQAIGLNPNYAIPFSNRGSAYAKKGKYDYAIADFDQAIRLDPKDVSARKNRKLAEQLMGNSARANVDVGSAPKNRNLAESRKGNPPETDANDANPTSNRNPPTKLKGNATRVDNASRADRKVAAASKARSSGTIKKRGKVQSAAVRARQTKPQTFVRRVFRQSQHNIRKMFRMISQR